MSVMLNLSRREAVYLLMWAGHVIDDSRSHDFAKEREDLAESIYEKVECQL